MIDIRKLLGRKATSSADLSASIAEAQAESHAATATVARLTQERASLLLTAEDEVLATHDAGILAAQRQRDRADAVAAELEKRHADMVAVEVEAGRRARFEAAKGEVEVGAKWLRENYSKHASEVGRGLAMLDRLEILIEAINRDLPKGEAPILDVEGGIRNIAGTVEPLKSSVSLPGLTAADPAFWRY